MKTRASTRIVLGLLVAGLLLSGASLVWARGGGSRPRPVVYVRMQQLYYDSIVTADPLPNRGPFQRLYHPDFDGVTQLETDAGPGDAGYVGGRWWIDTNGNGERDDEDHFFSCPLQGPGREAP